MSLQNSSYGSIIGELSREVSLRLNVEQMEQFENNWVFKKDRKITHRAVPE